MKKTTFWIVLMGMFVCALMNSSLYAEEMKDMGMMDAKKGDGKGMMGGKMMGMPMMMKMMMEKTVVATTDGGIVVVAGNKITKYDKDLNVVKEVETKMDMAAMEKDMKEMMAQCPMMKKMEGRAADKTEDFGEVNAPASGHEGHH